MKTYGYLWHLITSKDNVAAAIHKALQTKPVDHYNKEMKWFVNHFDEAVEMVRNNLISETYKFGEMTSFVVHEPKERIIHHPKHFIDRVYHCCLLIPLVPIFLERFTADTYGSIKGRGICSIIRNLKPFLHNHSDWYFLQIDIRKFYPSINHEVLKA